MVTYYNMYIHQKFKKNYSREEEEVINICKKGGGKFTLPEPAMVTTALQPFPEEESRRWESTLWKKAWEVEKKTELSSLEKDLRRPEKWGHEMEVADLGPDIWEARDVDATAIFTFLEF